MVGGVGGGHQVSVGLSRVASRHKVSGWGGRGK